MTGTEAQKTIDVLENNGYVVIGVNYPEGTRLNISEINDTRQMDGVVSFEVMPLAGYEANGFQA